MCVICQYKHDINQSQDFISVEVDACSTLEEINLDNFPNLKYLFCFRCPSLRSIYATTSHPLKTMTCQECKLMTIIDLDVFPELSYLDCIKSEALQEIKCNSTSILKSLYVDDCPLIKEIPVNMLNLTKLAYSNCPLIRNIPNNLIKLRYLDVSASQVKKIPHIPTLLMVHALNCRLLTAIPKKSKTKIYREGCPFLNKSNRQKVYKLQKFMKQRFMKHSFKNKHPK